MTPPALPVATNTASLSALKKCALATSPLVHENIVPSASSTESTLSSNGL